MKNLPLGECIYCGLKPGDVALVKKDRPPAVRPLTLDDFGREHIVPSGLQGHVVLGKASCSNCEGITSELERIVIRDMLWSLRSTFRQQPEFSIPDTNMMGLIPDYPVPAIATGFPTPNFGEFRLTLISAEQGELDELRRRGQPTVPSKYTLNHETLARFIAKVAHGVAVRRWGLGNFVPFLPRIVLGHRTDWWSFVGGTSDPITATDLHTLDSSPVTLNVFDDIARGDDGFIRVRVRLFGNVAAFPTYQAIAGVLTGCDPRIVRELRSRGFIVP